MPATPTTTCSEELRGRRVTKTVTVFRSITLGFNFSRSSFHLLSVSFFLLPSSDHPHRQTGSDWASGMPRISNSLPWEPTWCNLVQLGRLWRHDPQSLSYKVHLEMGSAPPFTTCGIGFYKTYVPALLPGSSLAHWLAASDAIPPLLHGDSPLERQKQAAGQCLQSDSFQMLAQSHPQGYNLSTVQSLLQTSLFLLKH